MIKKHALNMGLFIMTCLLAGCSVTSLTSQTSSGAAPQASPTGTISITTDHSMYAPTDVIRVTVSNHSTGTIYATGGHSGCTILTLEVIASGRWQPSDAAGCPAYPAYLFVQIPVGGMYHQMIRGFQLPAHPAPFPPGEYRLSLRYWKSLQGSIPNAGSATEITSSPFTVDAPGITTTPTAPEQVTPQPPVGALMTPTPLRRVTPQPPVVPFATPTDPTHQQSWRGRASRQRDLTTSTLPS